MGESILEHNPKHASVGSPAEAAVKQLEEQARALKFALDIAVLTRFREGGLHLIRRLSQPHAPVLVRGKQHGHPDVVRQWLAAL